MKSDAELLRPIAGGPGPSVRWIVCGMATRDVENGAVLCPLGGTMPVVECLDCHLLQSIEADWRRRDCSTSVE